MPRSARGVIRAADRESQRVLYRSRAVGIAKGFPQLRVDGQLLSTAKWPRLDRFKEHNIELPVGAIEVMPKLERELREVLDARWS